MEQIKYPTATTTDNSTAITTDLRTFDYSDPGSHIYKHLKAVYVSTQRMGTLSAALSLTAYYDQIATAIGTVTATTTTITTLPQAVQQGVTGYHIGLHISGTNTHKISNIVLKTLYEEDTVG